MAGLTEVDICNRALLRVGQKELIGALDENSTPAQCCNALYAQARDEVLVEFPWPFARRHATLALIAGAVRHGWNNVYALPADCLDARYIYNGARPGALVASATFIGTPSVPVDVFVNNPIGIQAPAIAFAIEAGDTDTPGQQRVLVTDQANAELVYTAQVTAPPAFPPLFVSALAWRLAAELALALPVKATLADWADKKYRAELLLAGATAFRGEQEDVEPDAKHISIRG